MFDPIGPGTAAWEAFDESLASYQMGDKRRGKSHRDYMKKRLRMAGTSEEIVKAWCANLRKRIDEKDFD